MRPGSFIVYFPELVCRDPAGMSALLLAIACCISSKVTPKLSRRAGFKTTSKTSVRSPEILASKTCGRLSIRLCNSLPRRCNSRCGADPQRLTVMMGSLAVLTSSTTGSWASCGNSARARSTFSRTSCIAKSRFVEGSNSSTTTATLLAATPSSCFKPSTAFNSVSKGRMSNRSASSGEIPGRTTCTFTKGIGTSGSASLGKVFMA